MRPSNVFLPANVLMLRVAGIKHKVMSDLIYIDPYENLEWADKQGEWQRFVKHVAVYNQDWLCECGRNISYNGELHHALVERNESKDFFIHNPLNCIVLHSACHRRLQGNRAQCYVFLKKLYGENLENWRNKYGIS